MATARLIVTGATFLYGSIILIIASLYTLRQNETWVGQSSADKHRLKHAFHQLWSLSTAAHSLSHNFLRLSNAAQLHYLSLSNSPSSADVLIVLLHGFPDSSHIWDRYLLTSTLRNVKIVALDLPGCGGSDSINDYGPNQVLNAVAEAIVQLKARYLLESRRPKCILIGHDWGGAIAFRIAAETYELVDHVVTINSTYPYHAEANIRAKLSQCSRLILAWMRQPSRYTLVREAGRQLRPVLAQLRKSGYMFLFIMPIPVAKLFPHLATALVQFCHRLAQRSMPTISPAQVATSLAISCGPSVAECNTSTVDGLSYGPSVLKRAQTVLPGDWDQRVLIYRQGLGRDKWTPAYSTTSNIRHRGLAQNIRISPDRTEPKGQLERGATGSPKFKCPVDIIYGLLDEALDPRIVVDGIEEFFMTGPETLQRNETAATKHVTKLSRCGHWSFLEDEGAEALELLLSRIIEQT